MKKGNISVFSMFFSVLGLVSKEQYFLQSANKSEVIGVPLVSTDFLFSQNLLLVEYLIFFRNASVSLWNIRKRRKLERHLYFISGAKKTKAGRRRR